MKVYFKQAWFGPEGYYFPKGYADVPNSFKDKLPKSAEVLDDSKFEAPEVDQHDGLTLRSYDDLRAASDEEARINKEADAAFNATKRSAGRPRKDN